ncbi:hypothetical protein SLA2020_212330 [Shorea laevis]
MQEPQERLSGGEEINRPYCVKLTKKIYKGDWQDVREFIVFDKGRITFPQITGFQETALHVAIKAEQDEIVKELIEMMSIPELEKMDCNGHTALSLVAFEGKEKNGQNYSSKRTKTKYAIFRLLEQLIMAARR